MRTTGSFRFLFFLAIATIGCSNHANATSVPILYSLNDRLYTLSDGQWAPYNFGSPETRAVYFDLDSTDLRQYHLQISKVEGEIALFCNGKLIKIQQVKRDSSIFIRGDELPEGLGPKLSLMIYTPKGKLKEAINVGLVSKQLQIFNPRKSEPIPRVTEFGYRNLRIMLIWSSLLLCLLVIRKDPSWLLESLIPTRFLTNNTIKELSLARIFQWNENLLLLLIILLQIILFAIIKSPKAVYLEVIQFAIFLIFIISFRFLIIPIASLLFEMGRLANLHITYALRTMSIMYVLYTALFLFAELTLNIDQQAIAFLQSGLILFFTFAMVANIFSTLLRSYAQINLRFISYICAAELLPMLYLVQYLK